MMKNTFKSISGLALFTRYGSVRELTCALLDSVFLSRFISERYWRRRDEEAAVAAGDLLLLPPPPLLGRRCGDWRWCDDDIEEIAAIERALKVEFENISYSMLTWIHSNA